MLKSNKIQSAGIFAGTLLGFATLFGSVMAAVPAFAASTPASSTMTVNLSTSMSLALYASGDTSSEITNLQFDLDPTGEMVSKGMVARVSTNAPRYQLTLQMSGATTDLVQSGATKQIVGTVTDDVTASTMKVNSWGYSLDATNFSKVPASDSPVTIKNGEKTTSTSNTSAYEDTTVTFGVKVDGAIQSGAYSNTVVITAIPQDAEVPANFFNITKMQEMTHEICTDTEIPTPSASETTTLTAADWNSGSRTGIPTTTLLDDRAGQVSYTVKKLADGKCWMTENLALPAGAVLSASDSDLDGTVVSSYTLPSSRTPFTNSPASDAEEMYDPVAGGGTTTTSSEYYSYKVGNYYSWRTATAGTGRGSDTNGGAANDPFGQNMNTQNTNTLVSICPKGWRLPTDGNPDGGTTGITTPGSATNLVNGDFTTLINAYGGSDGFADGTAYTQMTNPSYGPNFALSGYVYTGGQYDVSSYGDYWSSTVVSYRGAYRMYLDTSYVLSQDRYYKYNGQSVRCVSR